MQNNKRRPIKTVSFTDLQDLGFEILVTEFMKKMPSGEEKPSVKVVSVTKGGKDFPREYMQKFLWIMGVDTENCKWWVVPKKDHRRVLSNTPTHNYRYMGYERLDRDWIESGRASEEAIMLSSRMKDMTEVTGRMKRGGDDE